ncbi:MAG: hypothetical protein M5R38_12050 [Candidatus Methylomirabilis sp.]|nr:hypothetical protein [Candidatus Methylomirabilis sp.]
MQGLGREVRTALCAITPERTVGHQALQVEDLLPTLHFPFRDDDLSAGRDGKLTNGGTLV